jgi:A/G-specific adenine glycosylase
LGYYARARNLHKAAQLIVQDLGGEFPKTLDGIDALPGIGRSTAGAIMSFVYGARTPILDGNVKRVLARWIDEPEPIDLPKVTNRLWRVSQSLVDVASDPAILNQSLMELGATLCLPKQPRCLVCPVSTHCRAFQQGTHHERPVVKKRSPIPHHHIGAGILQDESGRVLIQQRPQSGLLGGLWEFPGGKQQEGESLQQTVQRELYEELGITVSVGAKITHVKHAYSHFRITLHAFWCRLISGEPKPLAAEDMRWVTIDQLSDFAFPKANHAILSHLTESIYPCA